MKKLLFHWGELKSTFWFVPALFVLFSIVLSVVLVYIDGIVELSQDGLGRLFFVNSANSARSILSTISGAMMGVAGTVFSITLVVLTLASSQFGPRLIKNFMYVRLNQIVLGAYISTYLYCLFVLSAVKFNADYTFIPSISILVAILISAINIILLIIFIHRIAVSIQADKVISDISSFIAVQVKTLFPEKMGEESDRSEVIDVDALKKSYNFQFSIKSSENGYLQYIDSEMLMEIIVKNDSFFELHHRSGSHLVKGLELGVFYTNEDDEESITARMLNQFVVGKTKTAQQDIEFSISQMVEIAARALSPGVNDPFTAITCVDNLTATLVYLVGAKFPSNFRFDEDNKLRVIVDGVDFEGVLDAAFNQIRQFSEGSTAVMIRLMEALITIYGFAKKEEHKTAILKHAEMVLNLGERTIAEKNDLMDLRNRTAKILK